MAVSQRDVPGWTRATLPLLRKHGILGVSFGAGTPPGKVDVPPLSVWRDVASGTDVVLTYETGYGGDSTLFVLPNGVALAVAWQGDNTGPAPLDAVAGFYQQVSRAYPVCPTQTLATWFVSQVAGVLHRAPRYPHRHSTTSSRWPTSRRSRPSCPS